MCGESEFRLCDEMFGHFLGSQIEVNWKTDFLKKGRTKLAEKSGTRLKDRVRGDKLVLMIQHRELWPVDKRARITSSTHTVVAREGCGTLRGSS
jgi:hypothetical protein